MTAEFHPVQPGAQELAAFRESLYRFFSECLLGSPTGCVAAALHDPEWRNALTRLLGLSSADLSAALGLSGDEELAAEHARLFVVPGTNTCPFESFYGMLCAPAGGQTSDPLSGNGSRVVPEIYRSWGVHPEREIGEVPDHAATELRFMSVLVAIEAQLRASGADKELAGVLQAQKEFLDRHILAWLPAWMAVMRVRARLPFYRALVYLLQQFLEVDRRTLELLI